MTIPMDDHGARDAPISLGATRAGALLYRVALDPSELPSVRARDLEAAWHGAREAAIASRTGASALAFRFAPRDGGPGTDLVLADVDALCWAASVDAHARLTTRFGLSVLLRLLGLVDLIARAGWAASLCVFRGDGADLDRRLLEAAARLPLTSDGRLDETGMRDAALAGSR